MAGNFPMNVVNNIIANNISTHEGGGIAIDDAPNVRIVNDTIVKNITTATAVTSNGQPWRPPACRPAPTAPCSRPRCPAAPNVQPPDDVQRHLLGQPRGNAGQRHGHGRRHRR